MQEKSSAYNIRRMRADAYAHAIRVIAVCQASEIDYDEESISANVECNFPELSVEECDDIANRAICNRS